MKIQVKQFAKKKIEALVKKDMQEWPPGCAGWLSILLQRPERLGMLKFQIISDNRF